MEWVASYCYTANRRPEASNLKRLLLLQFLHHTRHGSFKCDGGGCALVGAHVEVIRLYQCVWVYREECLCLMALSLSPTLVASVSLGYNIVRHTTLLPSQPFGVSQLVLDYVFNTSRNAPTTTRCFVPESRPLRSRTGPLSSATVPILRQFVS
jgi:hypothetical protein